MQAPWRARSPRKPRARYDGLVTGGSAGGGNVASRGLRYVGLIDHQHQIGRRRRPLLTLKPTAAHIQSMRSVSLLAFIASTAFALGQSKDASDYLSEPEKYEGKKIVLPCAYVGRASGPREDPQYVMFGAVTATKGAKSKRGSITVAVPCFRSKRIHQEIRSHSRLRPKRKLPNKAASRYFYEG
jgi:hypothetical protein